MRYKVDRKGMLVILATMLGIMMHRMLVIMGKGMMDIGLGFIIVRVRDI